MPQLLTWSLGLFHYLKADKCFFILQQERKITIDLLYIALE